MKSGIMLIAVNWRTSLSSLHQLLVAVFVITIIVHCVSKKNDTDVTHYRFNPHQPISVIFGTDVAEGVCY